MVRKGSWVQVPVVAPYEYQTVGISGRFLCIMDSNMTKKNMIFYYLQLVAVVAQLLFAGAVGFATPAGYWTYPIMVILTIIPGYALLTKKSFRMLPMWMRLLDIAAVATMIAYIGILALYVILFRNYTF